MRGIAWLSLLLLAGCAAPAPDGPAATSSGPSVQGTTSSDGATGPGFLVVHIHGNLTATMETGRPVSSTTCAHDYAPPNTKFERAAGRLTVPADVANATLADLGLVVWTRVKAQDPTRFETCPGDPPTAFEGARASATVGAWVPGDRRMEWNVTLAPAGVLVNGTLHAPGSAATVPVRYAWTAQDGSRVVQEGLVHIEVLGPYGTASVARSPRPASSATFGSPTDTQGYWSLSDDLRPARTTARS